MKKFTLKGLFAFVLILGLSVTKSFSQVATISPLNQNVLTGGSITFQGTAVSGFGNFNANKNFLWTVTPNTVSPASPLSTTITSGTTDNQTFTFNAPGSYFVTLKITATSGGSNGNTATVSTTVNVFNTPTAPNLWATSSDGNQISSFTVTNGLYVNGPNNIFDPFPSTNETTAALGRSDKPAAAAGYFYWLPNNFTTNQGVVQVYASNATGGSRTLIGSLDLNGATSSDLGFVRLGMGPDGTGWILAADGSTVYLAKFISNLANPVAITLEDANVTLSGGVASTFFNGDICFDGSGKMFALANNGTTTQMFIGNPNGASTTLTKRWDLVTPGGTPFNVGVNGVAFDLLGSLYVSTGDGLYFIDQNTVNGPAGTVQCTLTQLVTGLQDLASNVFPTQTTLPVDLISFAGAYSNQKTNLNWVTENLQDFDRFEVERSTDGSNFTTVATKSPVQTAARTTYLHTDDLSAVNGTVFYYRLKMIDLNGQFKYSNVILVRKESNAKGIRINPNPVVTGGVATLRFEASANGVVEFRIVDMAGRIVLKQQNNVAEGINSVPVNSLDRLQPGTYILQMNDGTTIQSTKFIVAQ